jgi:hypothetical protein
MPSSGPVLKIKRCFEIATASGSRLQARPNHTVNTDAPVRGFLLVTAGGGAPVTLVR